MDSAGKSSLVWLTFLYYVQVAIIPTLALLMWPFGVSIFNLFVWQPLMWLQALSYIPSAAINSFYLMTRNDKSEESNFTFLLDDTAIWLIVYWTANAGLFTHTLSAFVFLVYVVRNFSTKGYWMMFLFYLVNAIYLNYFHIFNGVEIIRSMQPLWKGTKSGKLWPALFYFMGLVDENGQAKFFEDEEEEEKVEEAVKDKVKDEAEKEAKEEAKEEVGDETVDKVSEDLDIFNL